MPIARAQLRYQYQWTAIPPDSPRLTGIPDSTLLNRHEGYEVLAFLNRVCTESLDQALKAERAIHDHLPSNLRSHAHVLQWLQSNWSSLF